MPTKENANTQASLSQPKATMFSGMPLPRPPLALANGQDIRTSKSRPYIEDIEDDKEPAISPLPFDADGPIIIEVLLSVGDIQDNGEYGTTACSGPGEEMAEENSEDEHSDFEHKVC